MKTKKWIAGYGSHLDWYIAPNTDENQIRYFYSDGDEYHTFAEAKKSLIEQVKSRIADDRCALKYIREKRKEK